MHQEPSNELADVLPLLFLGEGLLHDLTFPHTMLAHHIFDHTGGLSSLVFQPELLFQTLSNEPPIFQVT